MQLNFVMATSCGVFEVWTGFLRIIQPNFVLESVKWFCPQILGLLTVILLVGLLSINLMRSELDSFLRQAPTNWFYMINSNCYIKFPIFSSLLYSSGSMRILQIFLMFSLLHIWSFHFAEQYLVFRNVCFTYLRFSRDCNQRLTSNTCVRCNLRSCR
jgi:hypothetical protein